MSTNEPQDKHTTPETPVARNNAERLLGVYAPPSPDPSFAAALRARMREVAAERAAQPAAKPAVRPPARLSIILAIVGAGLGGVVLGRASISTPDPPSPEPALAPTPTALPLPAATPAPAPVPSAAPVTPSAPVEEPVEAAAPVPSAPVDSAVVAMAPPPPPPPPVTRPRTLVARELEIAAVGSALETVAFERRRVRLPDGSELWLDAGTRVAVTSERRVRLERGQVLVDVAPRDGERFVLETPRGEVTALGTRFGARTGPASTRVLVAHGKVVVQGFAAPLTSGQWLTLPANGPPALGRSLRPAEELSWARQLADEDSGYERGGPKLVVRGGQGEAALELRRSAVDVHVEDGFARTALDLTWFNHEYSQQEGTLHFPLPPDAVIQRLAMYVNGELFEGAMLEREQARTVYETIRYARRDPALLEWLDGNQFKLRVFPIEARSEKRVVITYLQRLAPTDGRARYRCPGPSLAAGKDWTFRARVVGAGTASSPTHELRTSGSPGEVLLSAEGRGTDPRVASSSRRLRDLVLDLEPPATPALRAQLHADRGERFLLVRWRPELPVLDRPRPRRDWVILFESAGDRDPALAGIQLQVLRGLLDQAEPEDTVQVLAASTRPRLLTPGPLPCTRENLARMSELLERVHLVGALDLGATLDAVAARVEGLEDPVVVHVGGAMAALGERDPARLVERLPAKARYLGVPVGRRWSRSFMELAAVRTNGLVAQVHPGDPARWVGATLPDELAAPRLQGLRFDAGGPEVLTDATSLGAGEELVAVVKLPATAPVPPRISVAATLDGQPWSATLPLAQQPVFGLPAVAPGFTGRLWARLKIEGLIRAGADQNKPEIVALSRQHHVLSPFTSLLVLENEAAYRQNGVARGPKEPWAAYGCPAKIAVRTESEILSPRDQTLDSILHSIAGLPLTLRGMSTDRDGIPFFGSGVLGGRTEHILNGGPGHFGRGSKDIGFGRQVPAQGNARASRVVQRGSGAFSFEDSAVGSDEVERNLEHSRYRDDDRESVERDLQELAEPSPPAEPEPPGESPPAQPEAPRSMNSIFLRATKRLEEDDYFYQREDAPSEDEALDSLESQAEELSRISPLERSGLDLVDVIDQIGRTLGRNILVEPGVHGRVPVSLGALAPDLSTVDLLARLHDLEVEERPGGITLLRRRSSIGAGRLGRRGQQARSLPTLADLSDPLGYAPGLRLFSEDVQGLLQAELGLIQRGHVDQAARALIDRARRRSWERVTAPTGQGPVEVDISAELFRYTRRLPGGLVEQVLCDGASLHVVYPDLGVGATRAWSPWQRGWIDSLVPWALAAPDELAVGADVVMVDASTVAVRPHSRGSERVELRLGPDGRLAERRWLEPDGTLIQRETYDTLSGEVTTWNARGEAVSALRFGVSRRPALLRHDLQPSREVVMLPLPARRSWEIVGSHRPEPAQLLAVSWMDGDPHYAALDALDRGDRRLGVYAFLRRDRTLSRSDLLEAHPQAPLALFLSEAWQRRSAVPPAALTGVPEASFLGRMQRLQHLSTRLAVSTSGVAAVESAGLLQQLERAVPEGPPAATFALLRRVRALPSDDPVQLRRVAALYGCFESDPELRSVAAYERARFLAGHPALRAEAREALIDLHAATVARHQLVILDVDDCALLSDAEGLAAWRAHLARELPGLLERHAFDLALELASRSDTLGAHDVAEEIWVRVLAVAPRRLRGDLMARRARGLVLAERQAEAQELLSRLDDREPSPKVWWVAADVAELVKDPTRAIACRERAAELEVASWKDGVSLERVQQVEGDLLGRYQRVAEALRELAMPVPEDLVARVTRSADRWRTLDPDPTSACQAAARVLTALGAHELAWDYLVTPLATSQGDARGWVALAGVLANGQQLDLAAQAWAEAFAAEQTNASYLQSWAEVLERRGRTSEAQAVWRRIADSSWQPRFASVQSLARQRIGR